MNIANNGRRSRFEVRKLEERIAPRITYECVKEPGPTDTAQGTNPAGNNPPGQSETLSNRECRQLH